MNWVQAADDASKVTPDIGQKMPISWTARPYSVLAGRETIWRIRTTSAPGGTRTGGSKDPVYCRQRSVYDAEREIRFDLLLPETSASWNAGTSVRSTGAQQLPDTLD